MLSVIPMQPPVTFLQVNCDRCPKKCGYLLHFYRKTATGVQNKKAPQHVEQPKTQKHWCAGVRRSPDRSMYFSIFSSGCKQPNLSTFQNHIPISAAKIHKKSYMPTVEIALIVQISVALKVPKNRPKISKMYYLRSINITPINLKRYATNT